MPIEDWEDMLTDSVQVAPFVSRDSYGAATFGTDVAYASRVVFKNHFIRGPDGEMISSRGFAIIARATAINVKDRITLSDGTKPPILDSNLNSDEDGPLYVRVDFG